MHQLQRVTTEYVDSEDRIRISGSCVDDGLVQLWLTRRLLDRLLPMVLNWLGRDASEGTREAIMQEFEQQAARDAMPPLPAVQAQDESAMLVQAVDVSSGENALGLAFRSSITPDDSPIYQIVLERQALRQWLSIVHDQYRKAEWPLDVWPAWITSAGEPIASGIPLH